MQMRKVMVGIAFAGALFSTAPVSAQAPLFDVASVRASCSAGGGSCLAAVRAAVGALKALGLARAAFNTQLGVLAGIAAEAAAAVPPVEQVEYAEVLNEIASESDDPEQIESLTQLAGSFETGDGADLDATASSGSDN